MAIRSTVAECQHASHVSGSRQQHVSEQAAEKGEHPEHFCQFVYERLEVKDYVVKAMSCAWRRSPSGLAKRFSPHRDKLDKLILWTRFHDIGKIGIPDSILKKPGPLTEAEWKVMRTHSSIGERIALEAADIRDIAHLILKHHEHWNGGGYPLGLEGEDIPIECRILAIADAYDAMTNDRPYRPAIACHQAVQEIDRCSGTQFDPGLVLVFQNLVGRICRG
jgi:HD-GYP domain-containing protein (c-di-GMP phosphodiesterase class II)